MRVPKQSHNALRPSCDGLPWLGTPSRPQRCFTTASYRVIKPNPVCDIPNKAVGGVSNGLNTLLIRERYSSWSTISYGDVLLSIKSVSGPSEDDTTLPLSRFFKLVSHTVLPKSRLFSVNSNCGVALLRRKFYIDSHKTVSAKLIYFIV